VAIRLMQLRSRSICAHWDISMRSLCLYSSWCACYCTHIHTKQSE
jgi:hypothetical protein